MLDATKLSRYAELATLLVKYGRTDFIEAINSDLGTRVAPVEAAADAGRGPRDLVEDLTKLGPTYVKLGQMLSTRSDLLSAPYLEALATLQDDVAGIDFESISEILATELKAKPENVFASIDPAPLAAASLAQVHRATLRSGNEVVVKVQRPNIQVRIHEDLDILEEIAGAVDRHTALGQKYEFGRILAEFRKALLEELDYRQEALNLTAIADELIEFDRMVVPRPVPDLVTEKVLVMDYVDGTNVGAMGPLARMESDTAPLAETLCKAYLHQILVAGYFHSDPHPGNVLVLPDNRLALIDMGMISFIESDLRDRLLRILLSLCSGQGRETAELALELGEARPTADKQKFILEVGDIVTRRANQSQSERRLGLTLLKIVSIYAENGFRPPIEIGLLGKTLLLLDEVSRLLDDTFDADETVNTYAHNVMKKRLRADLSPENVTATLLDTRELADKLPRQVLTLLDMLSRGEMRFQIDALNEKDLLTSLERIGSRIALGIVLAALIIGAALVMDIETPYRLFGYPALAIILFLAAVAFGFGLAFKILSAERSQKK